MRKNMGSIVPSSWCAGCGSCAILCPSAAVSIKLDNNLGYYKASKNDNLCINCGLCQSICPFVKTDYSLLNLEIFGKIPDYFWLGNYNDCFIGNSTDPDIRYNSSSGGMITQLLIWALDENIIDGALVTRMSSENPLHSEPIIARNKADIIEAAGSKYCPVPSNLALKEILNSNDGERFAVVGLPCQILGIRKLEKRNSILKEKIIMHLGLFCSHTLSYNATLFLLGNLGIDKFSIKKIRYRGEGWPGKLQLVLSDGRNRILPLSDYYDICFGAFSPKCCTLCVDHTNILADISFGDAWLSEYRDDNIGKSIIIPRNEVGQNYLNKALLSNCIEINRIDPNQVTKSQKYFHRKRKEVAIRSKIYKLLQKDVPQHALIDVAISFEDMPIFIYREIAMNLCNHKHLWPLLKAHKTLFNLSRTIRGDLK